MSGTLLAEPVPGHASARCFPASRPPALTLRLLSGFELRYESGEVVRVARPRKKAQALLAYLACHRGQAHLRDKLAALPWPDMEPAEARANLRQALSALRGAAPAALRIDRDTATLTPDAMQVDALVFEQGARAATLPSPLEASDLYRGDFLAGLDVGETPFEEWLVVEREQLRELAIQALAQATGLLRQAGDREVAVATARRLLVLDPLQEPVHRTVMRLYAELGRRDAALRQYQVCIDVLRRELDTEPEEDTRRLYQDILSSRSMAAAAGVEVRQAEPRDRAHRASAVSRELTADEPEMVGRETELADRVWEDDGARRPERLAGSRAGSGAREGPPRATRRGRPAARGRGGDLRPRLHVRPSSPRRRGFRRQRGRWAGWKELVRRRVLRAAGERFDFVHDRIREVRVTQDPMGGVSGTIERVTDGFKERLTRDLETVGRSSGDCCQRSPREPSVLPPSADIRPKEETDMNRETSIPSRLAGIVLAAGAVLAVLAAATLPARAATLTVSSTSDSGPGSLREALALAADGDTIDASGVSGTIRLTSGDLVVEHGVTINGPGPSVLTVDGNGTGRVFSIDALRKTVSISGLTIANGRVGDQQSGGGISNLSANLTLSDSAVTGNRADFGGGIYHAGGPEPATLTLVNCTLNGNSVAGVAVGQGGGIYNDGGIVQISRSRLTGNSANGGASCCGRLPAGRGGAIFNDHGQVVLESTTLSGNSATRLAAPFSDDAPRGGAIYNDGAGHLTFPAILKIFDSTVSDNEAQANIGLGGGIYNDGAFSGSATVEIVTSTLSGNSAGDSGGGIYSDGSDGGDALVQIVDSTLSGNAAESIGGGVRHVGVGGDARLQISGSTFSDNSAEDGGSIELFGEPGSTSLEVDTTIFAAGARGVTISNDGGTVTSHGHNLSSDGAEGLLTAATDRINTDPMLGPLQDNGGPTFTHELLTGSPAIDAVPVGAACSSTDQRGVSRPQGAACDIGAFERSNVVPTITSISPLKGAPGVTVILNGTAFTGAASVTFNGTPAGYTVTSATRITATVPAGATTGPIRVGTAFGPVTSAGTFTVTPRITGFVPQSGDPGASVVITGSNFTGATAVRFNGIAGAFHLDSSTQITATVPASATTGALAITTPGGTATSTGSYTVSPRITSFTPSSAVAGTGVVINGVNFTGNCW